MLECAVDWSVKRTQHPQRLVGQGKAGSPQLIRLQGIMHQSVQHGHAGSGRQAPVAARRIIHSGDCRGATCAVGKSAGNERQAWSATRKQEQAASRAYKQQPWSQVAPPGSAH